MTSPISEKKLLEAYDNYVNASDDQMAIYPIKDVRDLTGITDIHGKQIKVGDYVRVFEYENKPIEKNTLDFTGEKGEILFIRQCYIDWVDDEICCLDILYEKATYRPELNNTFTENTYVNVDWLRPLYYKKRIGFSPITEFEIIDF